MKPNWHYYEAHINLGDMSEELEKALPNVLESIGFKTTDIVNSPIEGLEQEQFHTILTTNDPNLNNLKGRVGASVLLLQFYGYKVNRYKIESTIWDSKYEDALELVT